VPAWRLMTGAVSDSEHSRGTSQGLDEPVPLLGDRGELGAEVGDLGIHVALHFMPPAGNQQVVAKVQQRSLMNIYL